MTNRELRTRRRAAERKAAKLERKNPTGSNEPAESNLPDVEQPSTGAPAPPAHFGFVSQPAIPATIPGSRVHRPHFQIDREKVNRQNAQLSTGPRTLVGKSASSRNSLKHGLSTGELIIPSENPAHFDGLLTALLDEYQPATTTEDLLVRQIAESNWLAQRALRMQNNCFTEEGVDEKRLALFIRYQTTHQRAFHKALTALIAIQKDRRKQKSGFVSQSSPHPDPAIGFVSKNDPKIAHAKHATTRDPHETTAQAA